MAEGAEEADRVFRLMMPMISGLQLTMSDYIASQTAIEAEQQRKARKKQMTIDFGPQRADSVYQDMLGVAMIPTALRSGL